MLNIPPHLEACRPRGLFSIFHGTSSPVARRCPRASDLVLSAEHAFLLYERPGLHLQSGASAVGGVLRGARLSSASGYCPRPYFNPRAPCGARPRMHRQLSLPSIFQSTRPVWGATDRAQNPRSLAMTFQSTRPVWGATSANPSAENPSTDFNPRAPCGARLATYTSGAWGKVFQSTRPVWGATLIERYN